MARSRPPSRLSQALVAAAAAGGVGTLVWRRRPERAAAPPAPPPPVTTQSSPGQIADLQQAYGADMAARPAREDRSPR